MSSAALKVSERMIVKSRFIQKQHVLNVKIPSGLEVMWPVIREVGQRGIFVAVDIAKYADTSSERVENYLRRLQAAGLVYNSGEKTTDGYALWQLTTKRMPTPFINDAGESDFSHLLLIRVWRAVRMAKTFTLSSLVAALDDGEFLVPLEIVRSYVLGLAKCGWLQELPAQQICGEKQYRIMPARAKGSLPPRLYKLMFVYDPNSHEIGQTSAVAEEVRW